MIFYFMTNTKICFFKMRENRLFIYYLRNWMISFMASAFIFVFLMNVFSEYIPLVLNNSEFSFAFPFHYFHLISINQKEYLLSIGNTHSIIFQQKSKQFMKKSNNFFSQKQKIPSKDRIR